MEISRLEAFHNSALSKYRICPIGILNAPRPPSGSGAGCFVKKKKTNTLFKIV